MKTRTNQTQNKQTERNKDQDWDRDRNHSKLYKESMKQKVGSLKRLTRWKNL
jgi:hypothetical protein